MSELEDILKHHGVKGMKWGVIRSKASKAGGSVKKAAASATKAAKTRVKEEYKSASREIGWKKELKNIHELSNAQLQKKVDRVRMENEFKNLASNQKVRNSGDRRAQANDKKEYRNREQMSDKQLQDKVQQLRLKDHLRQQISTASKVHRESARKLVDDVGEAFPTVGAYSEIGKQLVDHAYGKY